MGFSIDGLTGKVFEHADILGTAVGVFTGTGGRFGDVQAIVQNLQNIHAPDLNAVFQNIVNNGNTKNGVLMAVAGYVLDAVDAPFFGKYGKAIEKFGIGYIAGIALVNLLFFSTAA